MKSASAGAVAGQNGDAAIDLQGVRGKSPVIVDRYFDAIEKGIEGQSARRCPNGGVAGASVVHGVEYGGGKAGGIVGVRFEQEAAPVDFNAGEVDAGFYGAC